MANHPSFWQKNWKLIVNLITLGALIALIIAIREQLVQTFENLARVHGWFLLLLVPIEIIDYIAQTKIYQGLFSALGSRLSFKKLFGLSVELNFVNHVFPSGGVTGISYFGVRLRREDVTAGRSTIVQLMKLVLTFLSFELLLIAGFIIMAVNGHVNNLVILLCGALSTAMVVGTIVFVYVVGSRQRIDGFFTGATRLLNKLIHLVRPKHPETISIAKAHNVFNDLHNNYVQFRKHPKQLLAPFWWAFIANLTEVLAIYVVYMAFGHFVNFGAVILAYAVANFAGLVSVLPGGVGIYEGLMTVVLATAGVPASLSLPVTVMYRVLNTLLQVPPGYYLYHRNLRKTGEGAKKLSHG